MGANIMCVTSSGGIPLFTRCVGDVEQMSFSSVGSLNGVHLFSKSHGIQLIKTHTDTTILLWKEYEESVVLIAVSVLNDEAILKAILDMVFDAMVVTVGIEEIKSIKNVERAKRELRVEKRNNAANLPPLCIRLLMQTTVTITDQKVVKTFKMPSFAVIDKILECLDFGDRCIGSSTQILYYVETILCSENPTLQACLDGFVECISSLYGCVTIENSIAVATQAWWDLEPIERKLLSYMISANSGCTAFDIPVFLPHKSPNDPLRLVGVCLIYGIWVCVLCGPKPDISVIQQTTFQVWSPLASTLQSALNAISRNIPPTLQIHPSVFGFLLIEVKIGKYLSSVCSQLSRKESRSPTEVLKTFYYQAASILLKSDEKHRALETYWCSEYHKVHGLRKGNLILCLMYSSSVPTHTMRLISEESFKLISEEISQD